MDLAPKSAAAVIVVFTLAAYSGSFSGPFVLDDLGAIAHNPSLHPAWSLGLILHPPAGTTVSGRPLLNLSFALNYAVSGEHVWSYHLLNLLIHVAAALVLFGIVRRTLDRIQRPDAGLIAFGAALFWSVHPLQTEAVSYVVQRAESLMGLLYLLTLYCFIRNRPTLSWIACALGMATKEVMVTAPLLVLCYDRLFLAGGFKAALRARRGYYSALAATWALLACLVASTGGNRGGTSGFNVGIPWHAYWETQFQAICHYLQLSIWPNPLVFEYGTFWLGHLIRGLPYALVVLALIAGTWAARKRPAGFLGLWFFAILAVTSLVPGIYQMIVEHRMYLPLASVTILAALALRTAFGRRCLPVMLLLATALAGATFARNRAYRSEIALWEDTVLKRPQNETAQTSLAIALFDAGRAAEALPHYEEALRLKPGATDTLNDLGCALMSLGRAEEAISPLGRAAALEPTVPEYRFNLGTAQAVAGHLDQAILQYRETIRLDPRHVQAHLKLADALWLTGRQNEAIAERTEGLRLQGAAGP